MRRKWIRLSQRYQVALQRHLKQGPRASLQPARGLGRQAVATGLETLDVARIHEEALAALEASGSRDGNIKRAQIFFSEAITPIEETHRAALKANARLNQLSRTLRERTVALAASHRFLKQGIARRKAVERALKKSSEHARRLLEESHQLQKHLQRLTHKLLSTQEDERKKISRDLQDEIAQTLLGINVRLLTLKKESAVNTKGLQNEIAITERLVDMSVRNLHRFARKYARNHEG